MGVVALEVDLLGNCCDGCFRAIYFTILPLYCYFVPSAQLGTTTSQISNEFAYLSATQTVT